MRNQHFLSRDPGIANILDSKINNIIVQINLISINYNAKDVDINKDANIRYKSR